jgi:tRNA nucleotidyltransferase (CCA-adding enzyme)
MAIPESQLDTWAKQGSVTQSSTTYNIIKNALESNSTPYADKSHQVFLQGSYGNDTNIYAESDVDIVIQLESSFQRDLTRLSEGQRDAFNRVQLVLIHGFRRLQQRESVDP